MNNYWFKRKRPKIKHNARNRWTKQRINGREKQSLYTPMSNQAPILLVYQQSLFDLLGTWENEMFNSWARSLISWTVYKRFQRPMLGPFPQLMITKESPSTMLPIEPWISNSIRPNNKAIASALVDLHTLIWLPNKRILMLSVSNDATIYSRPGISQRWSIKVQFQQPRRRRFARQ